MLLTPRESFIRSSDRQTGDTSDEHFKDVTVYDPEQDREKGVIQKLYEGVVGDALNAVASLPRNEVATKADLSGPIGNPRTNTWDAVAKLLQNAFFKAILPGLEKEGLRHIRHS